MDTGLNPIVNLYSVAFISKRILKFPDMFSRSIKFTHNGNEAQKTILGGISSLFIIIIISFYSLRLIALLFQFSDVTVNRSPVNWDISNPNNSATFDRLAPKIALRFKEKPSGSPSYDVITTQTIYNASEENTKLIEKSFGILIYSLMLFRFHPM